MELTKAQWDLISPLVKAAEPKRIVSGRPRVSDEMILNGILWICRTGAPWKDMPGRYPPYQTCHRRYQEWVRKGVWVKILSKLSLDLKKRGKMDLAETFIDGSFAAAKKGALELAKLSEARVPRSWQLSTAMVFLSPFPHTRQVHTKLLLLKKQYRKDLSEINQQE
jgi:transposase